MPSVFSKPPNFIWEDLTAKEMVAQCRQLKLLHRKAREAHTLAFEAVREALQEERRRTARGVGNTEASAAIPPPLGSDSCPDSPATPSTTSAFCAKWGPRLGVGMIIAVLALMGDRGFMSAMESGDYKTVVAKFLTTTGINAVAGFVNDVIYPFVQKALLCVSERLASATSAYFVAAMLIQLCAMGYQMYHCPETRTVGNLAFAVINAALLTACCASAAGFGGTVLGGSALAYLRYVRLRYQHGEAILSIIWGSAKDLFNGAVDVIMGALQCVVQFGQDVWHWDFRAQKQRDWEALRATLADLDADDEFQCPLTLMLLVDPVDVQGYFIERDAANECLRRNLPHPVLQQRITSNDIQEAPDEFRAMLRAYTLKIAEERQVNITLPQAPC